ncbi:MAG: RNA chaperone Hfq [Oscillospiraceae bacterium]
MKTEVSYQDVFLTRARQRRCPVTVFLVNGFQMRGVIEGFDVFTVVLQCDGKQNLIYKHAISTIMPLQPIELREEGQ